jgi:hypothetical protein
MRAKGVGPIKAQMMYSAVYAFGPRWVVAEDGTGRKVTIAGVPQFDAAAKEKIEKFAGEAERPVTEITAFADEATKIVDTGLGVGTAQGCDAVVSSVSSGTPPYQLCGLDDKQRRLNAARNLTVLISDLETLDKAQSRGLIPAVRQFQTAPTEENWKSADKNVKEVRSLVRTALMSTIEYDPALASGLSQETRSLFQVLKSRSGMLDAFAARPPKEAGEVGNWIADYEKLMARLRVELTGLRAKLLAADVADQPPAVDVEGEAPPAPDVEGLPPR